MMMNGKWIDYFTCIYYIALSWFRVYARYEGGEARDREKEVEKCWALTIFHFELNCLLLNISGSMYYGGILHLNNDIQHNRQSYCCITEQALLSAFKFITSE